MKTLRILALTSLAAALPSHALEIAPDQRQKADLPPEVVEMLRMEMRSHLAALNQVISLIAEGNTAEAGQVAEQQLGVSSMGHFREQGGGPGRYMPPEMRVLGLGMHEAATRFALMAELSTPQEALEGLREVTAACVSCHSTFRVR